jgi:hypothetical protein
MWQCSSCSYTSCRKFNVERHEKLKHKVKTLGYNNVKKRRHKPLVQEQFEVYSRGAYCCSWVPCLCPRKNKSVQVTDLNFLRLSTHINFILSKVPEFLGCFSRNMLPPFPKIFPKSIIINTGHSSGPGIHWVALVLIADICLYFDPFGVGIVETEILDYVKSQYQSITFSNTCIQDVKSNKCGAFCVSFILSVKNKYDYNKFIGHFNAPILKENDKLLKGYFSNILIPL